MDIAEIAKNLRGCLLGVIIMSVIYTGCGSQQPPQYQPTESTVDSANLPTNSAQNGSIKSSSKSVDSATGNSQTITPIDPANMNADSTSSSDGSSQSSTITGTAQPSNSTTSSSQLASTTKTSAAADPLPPGQAGQLMLPIGDIYNQGMSGWCWAYSAFHTLRTYYYNSTATDSATQSWRNAIKAIDSASAFKSALQSDPGAAIGGLVGGDPIQFISGFQRNNNLPSQNWQKIDLSDRTAAFKKVTDNIRKQIPSVFCNSTHCRMIYGFVTDGTNVTKYAMADSSASPAPTYLDDASKLVSSVYIIITLVP